MEKLWKSVKIWQNYIRLQSSSIFFGTRCILWIILSKMSSFVQFLNILITGGIKYWLLKVLSRLGNVGDVSKWHKVILHTEMLNVRAANLTEDFTVLWTSVILIICWIKRDKMIFCITGVNRSIWDLYQCTYMYLCCNLQNQWMITICSSVFNRFLFLWIPLQFLHYDTVCLCVDNTVDYEWSSNRYSSWTESRWPIDAFQVRIFLMPSYKQEVQLQHIYCYLTLVYQ